MNMRIIKAPEPISQVSGISIFLAGSIEMGAAVDWQSVVTEQLADWPFTLFNPRRDAWDSSWVQDIANPQFREQVDWELDALERADIILMYFAPGTKSPISLLELGLFAQSGRMLVVCPDGFWRKGNVDVVCERYGVKTEASIEAALKTIKGTASLV